MTGHAGSVPPKGGPVHAGQPVQVRLGGGRLGQHPLRKQHGAGGLHAQLLPRRDLQVPVPSLQRHASGAFGVLAPLWSWWGSFGLVWNVCNEHVLTVTSASSPPSLCQRLRRIWNSLNRSHQLSGLHTCHHNLTAFSTSMPLLISGPFLSALCIVGCEQLPLYSNS